MVEKSVIPKTESFGQENCSAPTVNMSSNTPITMGNAIRYIAVSPLRQTVYRVGSK